MSARLTIRLSAPITAISFLPLLVGIGAAWQVHRSQRLASQALSFNVGSMRAAEELAIAVRDLRALLDHFLLSGDAGPLADIPRLHRDMDHWLAEAHRTAVTAREHELVQELTLAYNAFFHQLPTLEQAAPAGRAPVVRALLSRTQDILRPAQAYLDCNEEEIQHSCEENNGQADRTAVGLLLLGVCGPAAGLLAGYGIARAVHRSLVRLSVPVRDAAGKLNEVVGPITVSAGLSLEEFEAVLRRMAGHIGDMTERLQRSQREALRAEQLAAVGQMAAGFAHELRNPLMSMKLLVQAAADRPGRAGLSGRDLGVLEEEMTRLEQLTTTLLDFARPPQPERRAFEVGALVEGSVDLVSSQAAQRDVRIDCALPEEPLWAEGDPGQLRQVLLNLLLNALEAIQEGGSVRVAVRMDASCGEGGGLWIEVADTGPGLPASLGQDIFAPFVSTKPTGLGLGLSICRRILEAHGGAVTARDRPQGGAVFDVRLPCRTAASAAQAAP
jgi:signal transduction histidine kinase